jgi:hypothetical protein
MVNNSFVGFVECYIEVKHHAMDLLANIQGLKDCIYLMMESKKVTKASNAVLNSLETSVNTLVLLVYNLDSMDYSLA